MSNLFWIQFSDWLNTSLQVCKSMTVLEILLGVTNVQADWFYWLNFAVIIAKYFISKCKQKATEPCLVGFIMSTPLGGGYIIFAFFAVRCPLSDVRRPMSGVRMVSAHLKEKY